MSMAIDSLGTPKFLSPLSRTVDGQDQVPFQIVRRQESGAQEGLLFESDGPERSCISTEPK